MLAGLISLVGLELMGGDPAVLSLALFSGASLALPFVLFTGGLINVLTRKYVLSIGIGLILGCNALFIIDTPVSFILGNALRMAGSGLILMCISLYTMDFIPRKQLASAESRKMVFAAMAWMMMPAVGTWMLVNVDQAAPFVISAAFSLLLLGFFWGLRIAEAKSIKPPDARAMNFIRNVRRYFANPHMRVAYLIAVVRSCSWVVIFTYGPIYMRAAGVPTEWVGLFVGSILSTLLFSPYLARFAQYLGIRRTILFSFIMSGVAMALLGLLPEATPLGLLLLVVAALGLDMLETIGNIPFMRMVTPKVRVEMTSVFSTWREISFALTPGVAAVCLLVTDVSGLFVVLGGVLLAAGILSNNMPLRVD